MRTLRRQARSQRRRLYLQLRMHFLRGLRAGDEPRMPELQGRVGAASSAAAGGKSVVKPRCWRTEKGENGGAYRGCRPGTDGEAGSGRPGVASQEVGCAAAQSPHLRPPSEYLPRSAGDVGRSRRLGASRPRTGRPCEPQGGGPERLRLLTGHQRRRGQRSGDTGRQDPGPQRVRHERALRRARARRSGMPMPSPCRIAMWKRSSSSACGAFSAKTP